jgi:hypothetical protein
LVKVGDIEIKVSDSHTFWANNDTNEISVNDLIQGVSEIYVKVGNTFELRKVNSVSQLGGEQIVYSFSVSDNKNYISNGVVSHNSAPYCYTLTSQYQTVTDPTTFSITTGDLASGASYKVQLLITRTIQSFDTSPFTTYEASSARAKFTEPSGAITLKRISAGTVANGGGFQSVTSETQYIRHDKNSITGYNTDIKGGLAVDKIYGFSDTLDNAGTPTPFTLIGYDVAGYAMIKGYGRWTMNSSTTGTPATPVVTSVGGCITSLGVISSAAGQGKYTVNYVLTNALGGNSSITPSVFVQGIRDSSSDAECTFDYGKRSGNNASTVIHTQDNNVDTLNNMDELSIMVVM